MSRRQGIYWLLTIPRGLWEDPGQLPEGMSYIRGQAETGEGGFEHWQVLVIYRRKQSLRGVKEYFPRESHAELAYSKAALDYVWKEATRVDGTQFQYGELPFKRNDSKDWEKIWVAAKEGKIEEIPADVRICHYSALRKITSDFARAREMVRQCWIFTGPTATGKSRRAWEEAGLDAYPKDPRTKFWDGYQGEKHVVMDEFRGGIDISHLLRWLDRYPLRVEIKGASTISRMECMWITSNLTVDQWWPQLDAETLDAFKRRVNIVLYPIAE